MHAIRLWLASIVCLGIASGQGTISTIAGGGTQFPGDNGPATSASIIQPSGITTDGAGNIYFVETGNYRVRKINSSGVITTVAGTGQIGIAFGGNIGDGGPATSATFGFGGLREGIAIDGAGN